MAGPEAGCEKQYCHVDDVQYNQWSTEPAAEAARSDSRGDVKPKKYQHDQHGRQVHVEKDSGDSGPRLDDRQWYGGRRCPDHEEHIQNIRADNVSY